MKSRVLSVALASALLLPAQALAHAGDHPHWGFLAGLTHPLGGLDHLLAMVAVGLLAARLGGRALWALPALFVGFMLAGGIAGITGVGAALPVEPGIALSVLLLGALLSLATPLSKPLGKGLAKPPAKPGLVPAAALLVGLSGAVHGLAHGAELPAGSSALLYGGGALLMTALLHLAGLVGMRALADRVSAVLATRAARAAGLLIGTGGAVMVLAAV